MQLSKLTLQYLKKSFAVLLVAALVPAVVMGLFGDPFTSLTFLPLYFTNHKGTFASLLSLLLAGRRLKYIIPILLAVVSLVLSCSYSLSIIEKHFKTGKLMLLSPMRSINNSMLSVLKVLPVALLVCLLLMLLQTGLVSLIRVIFSGLNNPPKIIDGIWTTLVSMLIYMIIIALTVFMGVWAVIMQIFGFSFGDAFVEAIRTVSKKWLAFIVGLIVPITLLLIPQILLNAFKALDIVKIIVSIATHAVIIVYYSAYIMVSVFSLTGLERRDEKSIVPKA